MKIHHKFQSKSSQTILQKRFKKLKPSSISSHPLPNNSPTSSPQKKKSKDENLNSNIYHYFINDHNKLDELHMQQNELSKNKVELFTDQVTTEDSIYDQFGYLTEVELIELKNHYQDFTIGDYVIIFSNPDYQAKKNRPVSYREALEVFDKSLTGKLQESSGKIQVLKEKLAFIQAFNSLDDYVKKEGDEEDLEDLDEDSPLKKKSKKKQSFFQHLFKKNKKKNETFEKTPNLEKKPSFFQRCFRRKIPKENVQIKERKTVTKTPTRMNHQEEELLKKNNFTEDELKELKILFKKMVKIKIKKKFCQGGFLEKRVFEKKDAGFDYACENSAAKDFLTLVRNVILTKLTMNSKIHTRLFVSSSGKDILMVLKCDQNVLKKHADLIGLSKQMELGACDLLSLEPIDSLLRPLRLKNFVKMDEIEYKESLDDEKIKKNKKKKEEYVENLGELAQFFQESLLNPQNEIQLTCKDIYKRIRNINEEQFRLLLEDKSEKINKHLRSLVKNYKLDVPDPNTEIQNDCVISRKEWNAYFIYLCYLEKYFNLIDQSQENQLIKDNILFLFKLIFAKAVGDSNEIDDEFNKKNFVLLLLGLQKNKSVLKTIWSKLRMQPTPPFSKFFISGKSKEKVKSDEKIKSEEKIKSDEKITKNLWRTYEINEKCERSIFLNMEKMKVINDIILKNMNMVYLIKHQYIETYFPLHNYNELNLDKNRTLFNTLVSSQIIQEKEDDKNSIEIKKLFTELADEAENTDFNVTDESCLEKETAFNYKRPWHISIETIRNYFGEKIGIYFSFLSFYTLEIAPMGFLGLLAQIFLYLGVQADAMKLSFSILIIVWSTIFIEMWKRRQYMFAVRYGQLDFQEEEAERPDFKGF